MHHPRLLPAALLAVALACRSVAAQDSVVAITPPATPLPPEAASAAVTRFSFIVYGDTRGRHDGTALQAEHRLVVEQMLGTIRQLASGPDPVRFVLQSGDAVYNGANVAAWNVSYVPLINLITEQANVPYYFSAGNHDVTGAPTVDAPVRQAGLRNLLQANARLFPPDGSPRRLTGYPTYAFGYGNTFVIAFDSNIADDSVQFAWVKSQLEGVDRRRYTNVVAFFHHPVFSSGPHGASVVEEPTRILREKWMPLFRANHVRLLFVGHEHLFEHWVERYRDSTGWHRIDQVVSGGGGAPLYPYRGEPSLSEYIRSNVADSVRVQHLVRPGAEPGENPFHFVVVHVDGTKLSMDVVGVDWGYGFAPYRSNHADLGGTGPGIIP
jgi:hypothetical protein